MSNTVNIYKEGKNIIWEVGQLRIYPINKLDKKLKKELIKILKIKKDYYKGMKIKKEKDLL